MKTLKKIYIPILLFTCSAGLCWLFVIQLGIFGSQIDWISQHSVFPDYFRQLFYSTGNLFPDFAANIGGGQNIYYFSYYGLYNPVILLSYLLPFVKMSDYIMISSIACYGISVAVFYIWLARRTYADQKMAILVSLMFALATPLLYHSYNQLMFVNYMPFLCLALIGMDRFLEGRCGRLFVLSVCGMILSSYYFSICGILVLILYGSSEFLRCTDTFVLRDYVKYALGCLFRIGLAVLMSAVLLIPTALCLSSRQSDGTSMKLSLSLLIPQLSPTRILYSPYGIGLSAFALTVLISGLFYRGWREKLLSATLTILLVIPIFGYILNGGLYNKSKIFIPCVPILLYLVFLYMDKLKMKLRTGLGKSDFLKLFFPYLLSPLFIVLTRRKLTHLWPLALLDCFLTMFIFLFVCLINYKPNRTFGVFTTGTRHFTDTLAQKCHALLPLSAILILFITGYGVQTSTHHMVPDFFYGKISAAQDWIRSKFQSESRLYRTDFFGSDEEVQACQNRIYDMSQYSSSFYSSSYNDAYINFRTDTFQLNQTFRNNMMQSSTDNPIFLQFMGIRYLRYTENDIQTIDNALPVIYATDQIIRENYYQKLSFPENQTALLQAAVLPDKEYIQDDAPAAINRQNTTPDSIWQTETISLPKTNQKDFTITQTKQGYEIHTQTDRQIRLSIDTQNTKAADLLALTFHVQNLNPKEDVAILLENQKNKLTSTKSVYANDNQQFHFVISKKADSPEVSLVLGKGDYLLNNVQCYTTTQNKVNEQTQNTAALHIDKSQTFGNIVAGTLDVSSFPTDDSSSDSSWLITSIPYEKRGFTILVDDKKAETTRVNTAFLGCRIAPGKHQIKIVYHAPGLKAGIGLSLLGILLFFSFCLKWFPPVERRLPLLQFCHINHNLDCPA